VVFKWKPFNFCVSQYLIFIDYIGDFVSQVFS